MILCPLCETKVEILHKRSHILPKWMEIHAVTGRGLTHFDYVSGTEKSEQTGFYGAIVCEQCEKGFNDYDTYASKIFGPSRKQSRELDRVKKKVILDMKSKDTKGAVWTGLNFHLLQKFVFGTVIRGYLYREKTDGIRILSQEHFERIRARFLELNSDDTSYPIIIIELLDSNGLHTIGQLPCSAGPVDGHDLVVFQGACFQFYIWASFHMMPIETTALRLKQDGSAIVCQIQATETKMWKITSQAANTIMARNDELRKKRKEGRAKHK